MWYDCILSGIIRYHRHELRTNMYEPYVPLCTLSVVGRVQVLGTCTLCVYSVRGICTRYDTMYDTMYQVSELTT